MITAMFVVNDMGFVFAIIIIMYQFYPDWMLFLHIIVSVIEYICVDFYIYVMLTSVNIEILIKSHITPQNDIDTNKSATPLHLMECWKWQKCT
jgi:hypothetical protein